MSPHFSPYERTGELGLAPPLHVDRLNIYCTSPRYKVQVSLGVDYLVKIGMRRDCIDTMALVPTLQSYFMLPHKIFPPDFLWEGGGDGRRDMHAVTSDGEAYMCLIDYINSV